jgi:drug/metabolite transporter (DMT)-like permease
MTFPFDILDILSVLLHGPRRSLRSWLWPICFAFIGFILTFYRET